LAWYSVFAPTRTGTVADVWPVTGR